MTSVVRASASLSPADDLAARLAGSPYQGYAYTYPHKTAYAPLDPPRPLVDVWSCEHKSALELYVHVPFCAMRCGFCNLFTTVGGNTDATSQMLSQLAVEADVASSAVRGATFASLAIGGGTPTYLDADQLDFLLSTIGRSIGVRPAMVPTSIEASPETVTAEKLAVLRQHGVTRLSLGVQTFEDREARTLGRPQRRAIVEKALQTIADAAFPTLNLDLIYGALGQTPASWLTSVNAALQWQPGEIFLYPLYVRPLTGLARGQQSPMAHADIRLELYRLGRDRLRDAGYSQVNMRLFRRDGQRYREHALHSASIDGTLGLGCGARSTTSMLHYSSEYAVGRASVKEILATYLAQAPDTFGMVHYGVALSSGDRRRAWVLRDLLEVAGLSRSAYADTFGRDVLIDMPQLPRLAEEGLALIGPDRIELTVSGIERADVIGPWLYSTDIISRMESYAWR